MRLPETLSRQMFGLMARLLAVLDLAMVTEQALLARHGENADTLPSLEELTGVREDSRQYYRRLSNLLLLIADTEPEPAADAVRKLRQTGVLGAEHIESALLVVEHIKRTWRLP
ncbi:hypothetical protein [Gloeobacter morelensis]|uniref:hypothetical protein n=1 Tax=Gloeobacter morelensis TaxID=2907343 RepID=UPI001E572662|nr:hypothetical protein [Gloeobacter morelensis]UFP97297.1 hypothetical protein ISF26_24575 [Gloeobacter morelensis MG652769]